MALPASDEIHLLLVEEATIEDALLAHYATLLSSDERARHERMLVPADRRRFLITRAAIRHALSNCAPDVAPADWIFSRGAQGRPAIAGPQYPGGLTFNLSHAQDLIAIAIAREGLLGVDVENVDRIVDAMAVARRYFAPEEISELQALPASEQRAHFLDLWTLKEAWVKATGNGLAKSLRHASFALAGNRIEAEFTSESDETPGRWQFWQLRPTERHQIAIAYAAKPAPCGSGPCLRLTMNLSVSDMVPARSLITRNLPPSRTR